MKGNKFLNFSYLNKSKNEIDPDRAEYIKQVAEYFSSLNNYQHQYIKSKMNEKKINVKKVSPVYLNADWMFNYDNKTPPLNPEYFKQQELMSQFTDWLKKQEKIDIGFGSFAGGMQSNNNGNQNVANDKANNKKEEVKAAPVEEKKVEKEIHDVLLVGFDAAKKITLIKELKAITGLGLKESKDLTENLPSLIKKAVKTADLKELKDKLEALGAKLELK